MAFQAGHRQGPRRKTMETLRLLTFSTLYPNAARPNHGIFVENRLRHLVASGEAASAVVAPVPYFPSSAPIFGDWAVNARAPSREERHGLTVLHPRYPVIPKIGMRVSPWLLIAPSCRSCGGSRAGYGDGRDRCALCLSRRGGRRLAWPSPRPAGGRHRAGTDINDIPRHAVSRRLIQGAMARASALIAVSAALKQEMVGLGARAKVTVLRNGVDIDFYRDRISPGCARALASRAPRFSRWAI